MAGMTVAGPMFQSDSDVTNSDWQSAMVFVQPQKMGAFFQIKAIQLWPFTSYKYL